MKLVHGSVQGSSVAAGGSDWQRKGQGRSGGQKALAWNPSTASDEKKGNTEAAVAAATRLLPTAGVSLSKSACPTSVYNSGDEDAADGAAVAADGAAVAADGDGAPQQVAQVRRPKDTAPKPDAAYDRDAPGKWDLRSSADHVGNIGWLFGNWGLLPRAAPKQLTCTSTLPVVGVKVQTHAVACWELLQRAATDKRPAASCSAQPQTTASCQVQTVAC